MPRSNISAVLSNTDISTIESKKNDMTALLPFLVNLTLQERKKSRKMGSRRQGYVNDVHNTAVNFSAALPSTYDVSEFTKDVNLKKAVRQVINLLSPLWEALQDTDVAISNELIRQADEAYALLKAAARGNAPLDMQLAQIKTALKHKSRSTIDLTIGAGQTATINKVSTFAPLQNQGSTVLGVNKRNGKPSTLVTLDPKISFRIPATWRSIVVTNLSDSEEGAFSCLTIS